MWVCELIVAIVGQERRDDITNDVLFAADFRSVPQFPVLTETVFTVYDSQPSFTDLRADKEPLNLRLRDKLVSRFVTFLRLANMRHAGEGVVREIDGQELTRI
jgi:hypothetical protein